MRWRRRTGRCRGWMWVEEEVEVMDVKELEMVEEEKEGVEVRLYGKGYNVSDHTN